MSRTQIQDELLSHEFHLIDIDLSPPFIPPTVLWPTVGFSAISAPEMSVATDTIEEGTSDYTYAVLKKATTSPMTLSKGVSMFNGDFWKWMAGALSGKNEGGISLTAALGVMPPARRRNLLLIQSSGLSPVGIEKVMKNGDTKDRIRATQLLPAAGAVTAATGALTAIGVTDLGMVAVPGRAYMLFDCLPIRYKAAGDFDANTVAVSIEELEIIYTKFEPLGAFFP